jgi:hypothetical protein
MVDLWLICEVPLIASLLLLVACYSLLFLIARLPSFAAPQDTAGPGQVSGIGEQGQGDEYHRSSIRTRRNDARHL